jgi:hypothetical protein
VVVVRVARVVVRMTIAFEEIVASGVRVAVRMKVAF